MSIPIKCFTCGGVLADKYRYFQDEVRRKKKIAVETHPEKSMNIDGVIYFTKKMVIL